MIQDNNLLAEINSLPPDEQAAVVDFIARLKAKKSKASENKTPDLNDGNAQEGTKNEKPLRRFGGMKGLVIYMADDFDEPMEDFAGYPCFYYAHDNHFELLRIGSDAVCQLSTLLPHHRDPFDRLLIATAMTENLTLVSADRHFQASDV